MPRLTTDIASVAQLPLHAFEVFGPQINPIVITEVAPNGVVIFRRPGATRLSRAHPDSWHLFTVRESAQAHIRQEMLNDRQWRQDEVGRLQAQIADLDAVLAEES